MMNIHPVINMPNDRVCREKVKVIKKLTTAPVVMAKAVTIPKRSIVDKVNYIP